MMKIEIGAEIKISEVGGIRSHENLMKEIEKVNTFPNPQHAENERMGYSNWGTPWTLELFRWEDRVLILPRGFYSDLIDILNEMQISIADIEWDNVTVRRNVRFPDLKDVHLREYQVRAIENLSTHTQGCLVSPTGSGKSLIGIEIMRRKGQKSLVIVHRSDLAHQWQQVIFQVLGLKSGFIGSGHWIIGDQITIAMIQSISSMREEFQEISNQFGLVLVDECHHVPANSFYNILSMIPARYRYGLSATPKRRDGLDMLIYRAIGPCIANVDRSEVEELGATVPVNVQCVNTGFDPGPVESWNGYLQAITESLERIEVVIVCIRSMKHTLILVDRIEHAQIIFKILKFRGADCVLVHGQMKKKERTEAVEMMKKAHITVGTTGLLGEGLDVSAWEVLILASPISSEIKLLQAIGRVVRFHPGKESALVYDLKDDCAFAGASFKKRLKIYNDNNIKVIL